MARAEDWPQLQHDPARTGYTPEKVALPMQPAWRYDFKQFISGRVQPIIAGGKVFIGVFDGQVHALDAGKGTLLASFQTGGPILHSPAVQGDTLYVGSQDGKLYALTIAADSLTLKWAFVTGAGVWTSPLVYKGNVYFGSRDNTFYAVDPAGKELWHYATGGPILNSAATDGTRIYFASEDMNAYALDLSGKLAWQYKLNGASAGDYWPVVSHGTVIFRTQPPYTGGPNRTSEIGKMKGDPSDPAVQTAYKTAILDTLAKDPFAKTCFALDSATGKERFVFPVLYVGGCGNVAIPPPVDPDGNAYIYTFNPIKQGLGHESGSYTLANLETGQFGDVVPTPEYTKGKIEWIHDETNPLTLAGGTIFWAHMHGKFGYLDPATKTAQTFTGDAYKLLPRQRTRTAPNCTGVAIADGLAYWTFGGVLYAMKTGHAQPITEGK